MKKAFIKINNWIPLLIVATVVFTAPFFALVANAQTPPPVSETVNFSAVVPAPITIDSTGGSSGYNPCGWLDYLCDIRVPDDHQKNEVNFTGAQSFSKKNKIQNNIEASSVDSKESVYFLRGALDPIPGTCHSFTCPMLHFSITLLVILLVENVLSIAFVKRNEIVVSFYLISSLFVCIICGIYFYNILLPYIPLAVALHIIGLILYSYFFFKKEDTDTDLLSVGNTIK